MGASCYGANCADVPKKFCCDVENEMHELDDRYSMTPSDSQRKLRKAPSIVVSSAYVPPVLCENVKTGNMDDIRLAVKVLRKQQTIDHRMVELYFNDEFFDLYTHGVAGSLKHAVYSEL